MAYTLLKPYTDIQYSNFVVEYGHRKGLRLVDTDTALYALLPSEYMDNDVPVVDPNYEAEQLQIAKENKLEEANALAKSFLNSDLALYEVTTNIHIEATKENMHSFAVAAVAIEKGLMEYQEWTSKEDVKKQYTMEECLQVAMGIRQIQDSIWNDQYETYAVQIQQATTLAEVEAIKIAYTLGANNGT